MTEKVINLPIVFHFHQPVDNHPWVIEDVYKKSYEPLINSLFQFPELKFTLHFSGNLLEWLIENKHETVLLIKQMAKRGQIEIIGGGYYEPIFSIIPIRDSIAQMKKLSNLIKAEFGLIVKGTWLSERVWEPNYPSFLCEVGYKYVIVDDNHFRATGITEENTLYSYVTEDEGKSLRVFPINEPLRYLTPWRPTHYSIEYLRNIADEKGDRIALLISDAEKMGVWGTTHQICYVEGEGHQEGDDGKPFIPTFFQHLVENEWIKSLTLSECVKKFRAKDLVYLPTSSYDKMEEWALLTPIRKKFAELRRRWKDDPNKQVEYMFLKGGFWRYFLVKYPESNNMHKKMLYVREKLVLLENMLHEKSNSTKYQEQIAQIWDEIYRAQCNDCYWHGLFGGVYLQFLRFSVYKHLINAENLITSMNKEVKSLPDNYISIIPMDFNKNSKEDIIIESEILNLYINPSDGGTIFELDYKPKSYNLLNTMTRWREAYHDNYENRSEQVMIDRFRRSMLRTRIFKDIQLNELYNDKYEEFGDLINGEYEIKKTEKSDTSALLDLSFNGLVRDPQSEEKVPLVFEKIIELRNNEIKIIIKGAFKKIPNKETVLKRILEDLYLGIDFPFFFNGNPDNFSWESYQVLFKEDTKNSLIDTFEYPGIHFKAIDGDYNLSIEFQIGNESKKELDAVKFFKFPLIAYTFTDEGYKQIYQGVNMLSRFKLKRNFEYKINLKIS
jgi:4-alpha-glucanotransferase